MFERMTPEQREQWRNAARLKNGSERCSLSPEQRRETWQQLSPEQRELMQAADDARTAAEPARADDARRARSDAASDSTSVNRATARRGASRTCLRAVSFRRKNGSSCASRSSRRGAMFTGAATAATKDQTNDALAWRCVGFGARSQRRCFAAEPQLGAQGAKLLLTRAGFAPNDAEVAAYASLSHAAAVDRLLAGVRTTAVTPRLPGLTSASLLRANCGR